MAVGSVAARRELIFGIVKKVRHDILTIIVGELVLEGKLNQSCLVSFTGSIEMGS